MSQFKLITMAALFSLTMIGSASANPWVRYNRGFYGPYGPPVYAYPPVVVAPPPVVVSPFPPRVIAAPAPIVYGPPAYPYTVVGPRGRVRYGYTAPGFGVYYR
ncbi:MAG: hypothetical protein WCH39_18435 [Schlesneria sp.]